MKQISYKTRNRPKLLFLGGTYRLVVEDSDWRSDLIMEYASIICCIPAMWSSYMLFYSLLTPLFFLFFLNAHFQLISLKLHWLSQKTIHKFTRMNSWTDWSEFSFILTVSSLESLNLLNEPKRQSDCLETWRSVIGGWNRWGHYSPGETLILWDPL